MTDEHVFPELQSMLADMLDVDPASITRDSHLWDDLEVDSLSVLELAVFAEERYDIDLEPVLRQATKAGSEDRDHATVGWLAARIVAGLTHAASSS
jgi:acyl carrier protein